MNPTQRKHPSGKKLEGIEWVVDMDGTSVLGLRTLGDELSIAQVHPKLLCENLWKVVSKPKEQGGVGTKLRKGQVISPVYQNNTLIGAKLEDGMTLEANAILFACGPWGINMMTGVKYHSIMVPTPWVLS